MNELKTEIFYESFPTIETHQAAQDMSNNQGANRLGS